MKPSDAERQTLIFWGFDLTGMTDSEVAALYVQENKRRWNALGEAAKSAARALGGLAESIGRFNRSLFSLKVGKP